MNPNENIPAIDMYRVRWMGALVGALFAFMGILLVSLGIYFYFELMYWVGEIQARDFNIFIKAVKNDMPISLGITFVLFLFFGGLAGNGIVRAAMRRKNAKVFGFAYGLFAIFCGLWLGFHCILIETGGWNDFIHSFLGSKLDEYLLAHFFILGFSLIPAAVFGPLLGFSIEKLSKTPGFGLPKEE